MPHANLTREEARARAALLSSVAYTVELDLRGDEPVFPSRTVVRFDAEPGCSTFIDAQATTVHEAVLNGRELGPDAFDGTRLWLSDLAGHNELVVRADFAYQRSGVGLHRFTDPVDGAVYLHTQFEPFDANRVYACFDQPDLKASFELAVHAPEDWVVVSNTAGERSGLTWRFAPTLPVSTYITAVVAGPFHSVHDSWQAADGSQRVPLGLYCRGSLAEHLDADEFFAITKEGLDYFSERFDYPYPFGKYDQLLVPEFNWGAMENAGCVTFSESYVFRSRVTEATRQSRASTILHEMAHMWFGDLVTMRWWDDLWLNESFATYMGTRALAEATRFTNAWSTFSSTVKGWAIAQDQLPSTHPIAADIVNIEAVRNHFDGITYAKGASVLKQLAAWVGDEGFFPGLRDYFRRHEFANASLADFLAALEAPSGRDLGPWSKQWLETAGVATLRPELAVADGCLTAVNVLQETASEHSQPRDHRLAIGVYRDDGQALVRATRTELDVRGASTPVPDLEGLPEPELLLVNDDDLAYAKVRLDDRSLQTVLGGLGRLRDPLPRALCWGSTWDMVRDAELAARRFVALVADHAPEETEVSLLQGLAGRALTAADLYGAASNRSATRSRLAAGARAALHAAEPGSDAQLVWARALASAAVSDADLDWVHDVLEGRLHPPGLTLDTDLRWHLLTVLATHGRADDARIEHERARDATDMGTRRAATARAARPDAEVKAETWDALLGDDNLSLAMRRALLAGFWQHGQESLLHPYVERYPDALVDVWRRRNPEEADTLTGGLYPSTLVDEATVATAGDALDRSELPAPAHRIVAEQRDQTLRALRTRAADG